MKEQVIEILRNKLKQGTNKQVIWEADIDDIAEKIVKLLRQPDVMKSVCPECKSEDIYKCVDRDMMCNKCKFCWQTVL